MPEAIAKVEITEFKAPEKKCKRCDKPKAGLRFGVCADCNKAPRTAKTAPAPAKPSAENSVKPRGEQSEQGSGAKQGGSDELSGGAVAALVLGAVAIGGAVAWLVPWAMERFNAGGSGGPSLTVHQGGKANG